MTIPTAAQPSILVQYASTLPSADTGWTTSAIVPITGQEGAGQNYGTAKLQYNYGNVWPIGNTGPNISSFGPGTWGGKYMRIIKTPTSGSGHTFTIGSTTYEVVFTGICDHIETIPDGSSVATGAQPGGLQNLSISGLPSILDNIYVNSGWVLGFNASSGVPDLAFPLESPLFNAKPTQYNNTLGEMSTGPITIGGGSSYYFDLVNRPKAWTALQVVNYLLVAFAQPQIPPNFTVSGPTWTVSDPTNCLTYVPDKLDFDGKSVLDCINSLINPRRGCTWYCTVAFNVITFNVYSTTPSAITTGPVTLPATTLLSPLSTMSNALLGNLTIVEDGKSCFDYIEVRGNKPLIGMTLAYDPANTSTCALTPGWDTALVGIGSTGPAGPWDLTKSQGPAYEYIWRRFTLNNGWNGHQYLSATTGLRAALTIGAGAQGAYTGARTFTTSSSEVYVPPLMLTFDRFFPLPYNYPFTNGSVSASSIDMTQPLSAPMVFLYNPGTNTAYDVSSTLHVEVEDSPPALVLSGDISLLYGLCNASNGFVLAISIGIHESDPMVVSWNTATPYSEIPRVMVRKIPFCEQWLALSDTFLSTVQASSYVPINLANDLLMVDDTPKLQAWLSVLQTWYGSPAVTATWDDHSQIDTTRGAGSFQPGALVTTIDRGDTTITANCIVTGRSWNFQLGDDFGTSYTTARVIPDVVSIEGHPILKMQRERKVYNWYQKP